MEAQQKPQQGPLQQQQKKKRLTKKELEYFKNKLLEERQRVLQEMNDFQTKNLMESISDQAGENSRYSYHLGDTASLSYGREFSM
ncbi:MAG: hypothetical protein JW795_10715, partial [Chitinivibrionales bacterium]|nr:hypothetical protein [Chitinivibrionales bacterium]